MFVLILSISINNEILFPLDRCQVIVQCLAHFDDLQQNEPTSAMDATSSSEPVQAGPSAQAGLTPGGEPPRSVFIGAVSLTNESPIRYLSNCYERTFSEEKNFPRQSGLFPIRNVLQAARSQCLAYTRLLLSGEISCRWRPHASALADATESNAASRLHMLHEEFVSLMLNGKQLMLSENFIIDLILGCTEQVGVLGVLGVCDIVCIRSRFRITIYR